MIGLARLTCALFHGNAQVLSVPHQFWYTRGPGSFHFHHRGQSYHHPVGLFKLYTSTKLFFLNLQFYLHLDPGSCSPTSMSLRSPGTSTCPIIDAKVTVMLHLKPEWLASLVVCPGRPYGIAAGIDDKIAIFLHLHRESPIIAL